MNTTSKPLSRACTIFASLLFLTPVHIDAMEEKSIQKITIKQVPLLTYNQFAKAIYNKTLTNEQLTIFAKNLLQQRIDWWKKELKKAEDNNDLTATTKIPLYIRLQPNITPDDMLQSCTMVSQKIKEKGTTFTNGRTKHSKKSLHTITISTYKNNKTPLLELI